MAVALLGLTFSLQHRSKQRKKEKSKGRPPEHLHQDHRRRHAHHPYPKSSPTPLLVPTAPYTVTRDQALDSVLDDLQSSVARGAALDPSILSSLLETCTRSRSLHHGVRLHRLIPHSILRGSAGLSSKLLRLYASCGLVEEAHHLFDQMPSRNRTAAFAWNSLIAGYAELGLFEDAMALYHQMEEEGVDPDRFTFPRVLKACAGLGSVSHGEAVHRHAVRSGLATDAFVLNALVDMYAKCGDIVRARRVFDNIPDRDPISWNSMLTGYIRHGLLLEAFDTCREMLRAGIEPDPVTISSMLACVSFSGKLGPEIHGWALRRGLECNLSVANSLIGMYSRRSRLRLARTIFDSMPEKDLVSWNTIISAHHKDRSRRALELFRQMVDSGLPPDRVTFVALLSACANLRLVEDGWRLLSEMEERYHILPGMEHYGCMVNLLGRAGLVEEAYELVLKRVPFDDGPTVWGALLFACSVHGHVDIGEVAAERLFELEPDNERNFELMMKIYRNAERPEDEEEDHQNPSLSPSVSSKPRALLFTEGSACRCHGGNPNPRNVSKTSPPCWRFGGEKGLIESAVGGLSSLGVRLLCVLVFLPCPDAISVGTWVLSIPVGNDTIGRSFLMVIVLILREASIV